MTLRIAIGADKGAHALKAAVGDLLESHELVGAVLDQGVAGPEDDSSDHAQVAVAVAERVATGEADRGLLFCGNGLGVAISANGVDGVDAVTAHDLLSVRTSITVNRARVLCMGARIIGVDSARELVDEWLKTAMPA